MRHILFGLAVLALCATAASAEAFGTRCPFPESVDQDLPDFQTAVRYTAGVDGKITEATISVSSGIAGADQAAVQCVLGWSFDPKAPSIAAIQGTHETFLAWSPRPLRGGEGGTVPIGKPHFCWVAPIEIKRGIAGKTTVGFQIKTNGKIGNPYVVESSGNHALDAAALKCVRPWRYLPAVEHNEPIDVPWKAEIVWNTDVRAIIERMQNCALSASIDAAQLNGVDGITELDIALKGLAVESVTVTRSSGSAALDQEAVMCAGRWKDEGRLERVVVSTEYFWGAPMRMAAKVDWQSALRSRK